ncbi:MAG TPA: 4Fe-4S dicluster domain-containing protein [Bacteroidetes bacterium]|nr:3-chloro-4-hydroxyphenylacetate reductive dehalogenase precursor [bacterium BMS3Bbin04]HDO64475.1 4Fe-4S dicluster domain-containing protein [Bacteroidota bacterium]HEX03600.1 4Fe-4S dicluster domain-containing protein [Bacteroidota bacterium]
MRFAPSVAYEFSDKFRAGFLGIQISYATLEMQMPCSLNPLAMQGDTGVGMTFGQMFAAASVDGGLGYSEVTAYADMSDAATAIGFGGTAGFQYDLSENNTFGFSYTSETNLTFDGEVSMDMNAKFGNAFGRMVAGAMAMDSTLSQLEAMHNVNLQLDGMNIDTLSTMQDSYHAEIDFAWPQQIGTGVAFQVSDDLLIGVDVGWINWSATMESFKMSFTGGTNDNINTMMGTPDGNLELEMPLDWKDQTVIAIGAEYLVNERFALRGGFNYASNPVPDETVPLSALFQSCVGDNRLKTALILAYVFNMFTLTWKRVAVLVLAILFLPVHMITRGRRLPLPRKRVDERDTMFARLARKSGTSQYNDYYARRPEFKRVDDSLRRMTPLGQPGSKYYDENIAEQAEDLFDKIPAITVDQVKTRVLADRVRQAANRPSELKAIALELGAVAVGFTHIPEALIYSHHGRSDRNYGKPIQPELESGLVFLVEMDHEKMQHAPGAMVYRESALQYNRAAIIAKTLAAVLKMLGHQATPQFDGSYKVILPPLAEMAGLGEIGRNNILIADRYGSRVRIGAVTTDMQLPQSAPLDLGVQHFCTICKKCAVNCPSHSLSSGSKETIRGVKKWPTQTEKCVAYWRSVGSDCGICMAVCPYSHKTNLLHNSVRQVIRYNKWLRHLANWGDDLIYGKSWKISKLTGREM